MRFITTKIRAETLTDRFSIEKEGVEGLVIRRSHKIDKLLSFLPESQRVDLLELVSQLNSLL